MTNLYLAWFFVSFSMMAGGEGTLEIKRGFADEMACNQFVANQVARISEAHKGGHVAKFEITKAACLDKREN